MADKEMKQAGAELGQAQPELGLRANNLLILGLLNKLINFASPF